MKPFYAVAILEGYLSQHHPLPPMVQQALETLKAEHPATTVPEATAETTTKHKRRKMTKEQRERNSAQLARMRDIAKKNREARNAIKHAA